MWSPTGFGRTIFEKRYAFHENETWEDACSRVATHVASCEMTPVEWKSAFEQILKDNLLMPGGRILYSAGRPKGQMLNCFCLPTADSREGWGDTVRNMLIVSGTGGGVGINFSPVRPRGSAITGQRGTATGAVSLMEIVNSAGEVIKAGGGRRTALMFCLSLNHGDLAEFLDKKLDRHELNNANVSVFFDGNPEEFFDAVKHNKQWTLTHNGRQVGEASAKNLWDKIVANALKSGEPGLLNGYYANKMSNIWYHAPLISPNPCAELFLSAYDCCCLGALVLPRFIKDGKLNRLLLEDTVATSVRFLDNVLTTNTFPLPEIAETCQTLRRIGLGIMGLHDALLQLGFAYNSPAGLECVDSIMKIIKNAAYEASIKLAAEKGSFAAFNPEKFLQSGFCKTLKPSIRAAIAKHGIRNCTLLTIAPTGTTSLVCDVTSGIEPMYAPVHVRKYRDGDALKSEVVIHPMFKQFVDEGKSVDHFQGAYDISLRDHFEMQRVCQRHLDNACSKTINVQPGTSAEELSALYMEYFPELKGITVYPEGSREDQPLTPIPPDLALQYARGELGPTETIAAALDPCRSGKCDI